MNYTDLSKEISFALRHAPWEYELELDEQGYVPISQLLFSLNETGKYTDEIKRTDLEHIIETSDKKRHEISGDKIRALYGHSTPHTIKKELCEPPKTLFHGTSHKAIDKIMEDGLLPMSRQFVHLSTDIETAQLAGKRRDSNPIILQINAKEAYENGVIFYKGNDIVWLCDNVPPKYITALS